VLCLALSFISHSKAQTVDPTTGNLINTGTTPTDTTSIWNNGVYVSQICFQAGQPGNCGPKPSVRPDGSINFSYGQIDLNQVVNINRALAAGGSGVQLSGFNFGFRAKNGNGWDDGRQDYLDAYVKFYNTAGTQVAAYDYLSHTNAKYNWTDFNFSETFANPIAATNYSNARVGFVGKDNNFWAGNYGPEITNVSFSLKYRVDPCSLNPAYSPNCSGFSSVVTSGNLVNSNLMSNGDIVYNSFAINTALKSSGAGVEVYGFNYGYNYSLGNGTRTNECVSWDNAFTCGAYLTNNPNATMRVRLTNSSNDVIYTATQSRSTPNTAENVSYQFLLASTTNSLSLGNFTLGASTSGNAAIQNMYVNALYKPDPCVTNPLSSTTCPGYAVAYAKNMILGSTVASASAPAAPAPAAASPEVAQSAPALASPDPAQPQQQAQQQPAQQSPQQQSASTGQDPNQNPVVAQDNPAQSSPQQAGPAPTTPQPAGGPPQTAQSAPPTSSGPQQAGPSRADGPRMTPGAALNVARAAQERDKATQQMAVQNAVRIIESSTQQSQATAAAAIASLNDMSANSAQSAAQFSSQSTQASIQSFVQPNQPQQVMQVSNTQSSQSNKGLQQSQPPVEIQQASMQSFASIGQIQQPLYTSAQQDTQSSMVNITKPPVVLSQETTAQTVGATGLVAKTNPIGFNLYSLNTNVQPAPTPVMQFRTETKSTEVEAPAIQIASFGSVKAGNPLSDLMQQRFEMMQENIQQQTSSVNKNVQPNDLAGGVDIASMALQPKGFEAYSFTIKDATFYEPKEVYKGQTVVDNVRALRQMSSDSLHKQMVDSQYKLGE